MCMSREAEWDLYRTLLAVLRHGSFSAAARSLGVAQPTAGRQIEALAWALGTALFKRWRRGLVPTRTALALLPQAEAMAAAAAAAHRACSAESHAEVGAVRVTASELVSHEILPPMLAEFCVHHPAIEL